jgi:nucleoside-diphosphate-sugar epimerase
MAKVLVTGASGFIGLHLIQALVQRGEDVSCLVRKASHTEKLRSWGTRLIFGDITDPDGLPTAVAGQQFVYHLAGITKALTRDHYYQVNQLGMRNIVRACAAATTPPVLTVVSSLAAAGPSWNGRPRVESEPAVPVSHYGRSKRAGEKEVEAWAARVPITIIRPPIVFGEGDHMTLPMFQAINRFGVHAIPGIGRHRFSVIHVADLVDLLWRAAHHGKRIVNPRSNGSTGNGQGYYFAACEENPVYDDFGRMIAVALGNRFVLPLHIATPMVWLVSYGVEVFSRLSHYPFSLHLDKAREITAGSWTCSPQVALNELNFRITAPLLERLRQTADWYRKKGWL